MLISDWSSDVCSSDLGALVHPDDRGFLAAALGPGMRAVTVKVSKEEGVAGFVFPGDRVDVLLSQKLKVDGGTAYPDDELFTAETIVRNVRSEEHTSELQSLMRISYAVFCLKKKKT